MLTKQALSKEFNRSIYEAKDNWKMECPFHEESTPSFFVHKEEGLANCFGCGISGYIDILLGRYAGISSKEAQQRLSITLSERVENKLLRSNLRRPSIIYPESWLEGWRKEIHKYVYDRGLRKDVLIASDTRYDPVRQRQVFPHRDREGKLVGAIGRSCTFEDPKWYFYWSYDKGRYLYYPCRTEQHLPLIIVEGVFDALWIIQQGYRNVAATLGTKVTRDQLADIKRSSTEAILAFDNDSSGREATERVGRVLRKSHKLRYVTWSSDCKDLMDIQDIGTFISKAQTKVELHVQRNII